MVDKKLERSIEVKKRKRQADGGDKKKKGSKNREESLIEKRFRGDMAQVKFLGCGGRFWGFGAPNLKSLRHDLAFVL
jgi:hypothetical protein